MDRQARSLPFPWTGTMASLRVTATDTWPALVNTWYSKSLLVTYAAP